MTGTGTEAGAQGAVDLVFQHALQLVKNDPAPNITVLAEILAGPDVPLRPAEQAFPAVPKPAVLTEEAREAFAKITELYGEVGPKQRRTLTRAELRKLTEERMAIDAALTALESRKKSIGEIIRTHQDVAAEEAGLAVPRAKLGPDDAVIVEASPRDAGGHYLLARPKLPAQEPVPDLGRAWSQEYAAGKLVLDATGKGLKAALDAGDLSRETYLVSHARSVCSTRPRRWP
jgi:hypothetical protein